MDLVFGNNMMVSSDYIAILAAKTLSTDRNLNTAASGL